MPPPLSALLVLPVTAAPRWKRPRLGRSRRARPAVVRGRAAALRALPWRVGLWPPRLAPVEVTPPPSSAARLRRTSRAPAQVRLQRAVWSVYSC
ncbi:hypothetical protein PR202_gb22717 [Eleusine coracana subsp. coracana]|uniref:Secreted protein n=1 Tax=Eleusine coracana subsp. coracana TaxID=191504 RepID=A0AAV5FEE2_ELECO|nr:hypothetical protein PR202_gb22717 [Eleusine coracana subsp. coracana]